MGLKLSFSAAFFVGPLPAVHQPVAGDRLPGAVEAPDTPSRPDSRHGTGWGGDTDPTLRFGLELDVHCHMLIVDGAYTQSHHSTLRLYRAKAPSQIELAELVHTLSHRIARFLGKCNLLKRDAEKT